jgi:hypothetical protein
MADNRDEILSEFDAQREAGDALFVPQPGQMTLAGSLQSIESLSELMNCGGDSLEGQAS